MLQHLSISNYALISYLEVDFSEGLSIITGETGAGKSIIIGAFSLILGQRADTGVLLDKTKKCIIEGSFNIKGFGWKDFFESNELDYDDQVILRREINQQGKSRAFINDSPVNLNLLKELGDKLVDIHSQHKTLSLNDSSFQLAVVDDYMQQAALLQEYRKEYSRFKNLNAELNSLVETEQKAKADKDYFQFQFDELEAATLVAGEQGQMENELQVLSHTEEIKTALTKALMALDSGDSNVVSLLNELQSQVSPLASFSPQLQEISKRLQSSYIELKDLSGEIENVSHQITFNPERIEQLTARLDNIYRLQQKHRLQTIEGLIALKDELSEKLFSISSLDDKITKLRKEVNEQFTLITKLASQISANRKKGIPSIEKELKVLLAALGIPNGEIQINQSVKEIAADGTDNIRFLFSANKGSQAKDLSKVASGGELSRLMLSIKSLISQKNLLPTIIFDEIDMGVSGEVAAKVGTILNKMSMSMQVIAITHLPQIAGKGKTHYFVYKEIKGNTTESFIKKLSEKERITEIAKMLSGETLSKSAVETAKELLERKN